MLVAALPFEIVYAFDELNDKIATFNRLISECLNRHAPLKRTKVTRSPAPWLNDPSIRSVQVNLANQRQEAHARPPQEVAWDMPRYNRNKLKNVIKKAKRSFMITTLSFKRPKEVWRTIHRILHPSQQPLHADPDDLNWHLTSTAERVTASSPVLNEDIYRLIGRLTDDSHSSLRFYHVTHQEVLRVIKGLPSNCSTGPSNIPAKFVKLVAEHLASPLSHIINSCLDRNEYPLLWKRARISLISKVDEPRTNNDYRPISILPVLSKVFEKLALRQITGFLTENAILKSNISSYRKCHSTTTTILAMRDDILKAMKRGEITLAVMADFSRAFDTVAFEKVLSKLHPMGFSRTAPKWIASYITSRKQFVQVDDHSSAQISTYGVP